MGEQLLKELWDVVNGVRESKLFRSQARPDEGSLTVDKMPGKYHSSHTFYRTTEDLRSHMETVFGNAMTNSAEGTPQWIGGRNCMLALKDFQAKRMPALEIPKIAHPQPQPQPQAQPQQQAQAQPHVVEVDQKTLAWMVGGGGPDPGRRRVKCASVSGFAPSPASQGVLGLLELEDEIEVGEAHMRRLIRARELLRKGCAVEARRALKEPIGHAVLARRRRVRDGSLPVASFIVERFAEELVARLLPPSQPAPVVSRRPSVDHNSLPHPPCPSSAATVVLMPPQAAAEEQPAVRLVIQPQKPLSTTTLLTPLPPVAVASTAAPPMVYHHDPQKGRQGSRKRKSSVLGPDAAQDTTSLSLSATVKKPERYSSETTSPAESAAPTPQVALYLPQEGGDPLEAQRQAIVEGFAGLDPEQERNFTQLVRANVPSAESVSSTIPGQKSELNLASLDAVGLKKVQYFLSVIAKSAVASSAPVTPMQEQFTPQAQLPGASEKPHGRQKKADLSAESGSTEAHGRRLPPKRKRGK